MNTDPTGQPFVSDVSTPRVLFGVGQFQQVQAEVQRLKGHRVLLVSTRSQRRVAEGLQDQLGSVYVDHISGVAMHVPVEDIERASARARKHDVDLLLCIGGGSAIGLAKALALELQLPILAIPTTYAGSEMTTIWGRSDGGVKLTGRDSVVLPRCVVYDPLLTLGFPAQLSASSGMNALAHCVEGLYSPSATPVTSMYGHEGMGTLVNALPLVVRDPTDIAQRSAALYGAWLAGWSLNATSMGLHHKLCHVLGGLGLPHSGVHSVLLPYVTSWVSTASPHVTNQISTRYFGGSEPGVGLWNLARQMGAPTSLAEVGYSAVSAPEVVRQVLVAPPESLRPITVYTVELILSAAERGESPAADSPSE